MDIFKDCELSVYNNEKECSIISVHSPQYLVEKHGIVYNSSEGEVYQFHVV